jgi:hypothetical protein
LLRGIALEPGESLHGGMAVLNRACHHGMWTVHPAKMLQRTMGVQGGGGSAACLPGPGL